MTKTSNPITLLFDANPLAQAGKSGVGYYTEGVIRALAETYPNKLRLIGHYYDFLGKKKPELPTAPNITYIKSTLIPSKLVYGLRKVGVFIPIELIARVKADAIFYPNYFAFPSLFHIPIITTIHDTYFMRKPEEVSPRNATALKRFVPRSLDISRRVFTVSQFSKSEVEHFFGTDPQKITVTPIPPSSPIQMSAKQAEKHLSSFGVTKGFLLFIGNLEPRKNLANLIRAYRLMSKQFKKAHPLVLAGGKGWQDAEIVAELKDAIKSGANIIQTGYVTDIERAALYTNAAALVLPSQYEGFGMQLLESMSYGKPVLASDIPVFHEVAGASALYFNPKNPRDIADTLALVDSQRTMGELVKKQRNQLAKYQWDKVAAIIFDSIKTTT